MKRAKVAFLLLWTVFALLAGCQSLRVGREYGNLAELERALPGHVVVGKFGQHWPARVTQIIDGEDSVAFVRADGQRHAYSGYEGYALKAVRLAGEKGETVIVFRSRFKRGEAPPEDPLKDLTK